MPRARRARGAAGEAVEELRHELRRHALAVVLHRHPQRAVLPRGADEHRGLAVAAGVEDQVRDDPVERRPRPARPRATASTSSPICTDSSGDTESTISSSRSRTRTRCGRITTASASRRERSSSCSTSSRSRRICVVSSALQLLELLRRELVAPLGDRLREPVDRADRRAELVRGERDELALQLVGPLQRLAGVALLREEARAVERETRQRAERGAAASAPRRRRTARRCSSARPVARTETPT